MHKEFTLFNHEVSIKKINKPTNIDFVLDGSESVWSIRKNLFDWLYDEYTEYHDNDLEMTEGDNAEFVGILNQYIRKAYPELKTVLRPFDLTHINCFFMENRYPFHMKLGSKNNDSQYFKLILEPFKPIPESVDEDNFLIVYNTVERDFDEYNFYDFMNYFVHRTVDRPLRSGNEFHYFINEFCTLSGIGRDPNYISDINWISYTLSKYQDRIPYHVVTRVECSKNGHETYFRIEKSRRSQSCK